MAEATININVKTDNSGVKSLKTELREANIEVQKLANAKVIDETALNAAILKTAELKDRMNDVNEQVKVLTAGSKFEALGNSIGDIGGKILTLDFEGANESAQRLVKLTKTITLGDAVKGVKDLGSTFLNLGKALLTNPLFLIGAAIALAVTAVVKLLDKMGVLKKIGEVVGWIFEKIGEFIEYIADSTAAVVDMVFGTTLVAEKQAQQLAEQQDKLLVSVKARSQAVVEGADREIKEQKALGKNTEALEKKKLELIVKTAEVEFRLYQERFKNKTYLAGLDQEEIENQRKLYKESLKGLKDAKSDLKVFNNEQQTEKENAIKKDAESSKAAAEKAAAAAKQYRADRLAAERQFEDLRLSNLPDGVDKELAINAEKYKRLIEDTKKNEKLLVNEKIKIIAELGTQQISAEEKIRANSRKAQEAADAEALKLAIEAEKEFQAKIEALQEENFQATLTEQGREIQAVQDKYFELETLAEGNAEALAEIEIAKNRELKVINDKYYDEQKAKDEEALKKKIETYQKSFDELAGIFKSFGSTTGDILAGISSGISDALQIQLTEFEDNAKGKAEKVAAYAEAIAGVITAVLNAVAAANKEKLAEDLAAIDDKNSKEQESLKAKLDAGIITREEFDKAINDLDKKSNAEKDKKGKEAFDKNKKLQIATAAVQGLQGAVSAFAGAMSLGPIAGPIVGGILAAAVAGLTAANIAKIKSTQYASAGGGGGGSATPSVGSGGSSSAAAQPQFNLFGGGNNANTIGPGAGGNEPTTQAMNINSTVSVTEISAKQNKVAVIEERSSL